MGNLRFVALTTSDNKWNPFTNFNEWFDYDHNQMKYDTCSLFARCLPDLSDELPINLRTSIREQIIDSIIANIPVNTNDPNVKYKKVVLEEDDSILNDLITKSDEEKEETR